MKESNQERLLLSHRELVALLAMGGQKRFYGYDLNRETCTREQVWNVCCELMEEGLITQTNGQFQLREDLFRVIIPLLDVKRILVFRKNRPEPLCMYYVGSGVTEMEVTMSGQYSLRALQAEMLPEKFLDIEELDYCLPDGMEAGPPPEIEGDLSVPVEKLLEPGCPMWSFLDRNGDMQCRIRVRQTTLASWLEIADKVGCRSAILTRETLKTALFEALKE